MIRQKETKKTSRCRGKAPQNTEIEHESTRTNRLGRKQTQNCFGDQEKTILRSETGTPSRGRLAS